MRLLFILFLIIVALVIENAGKSNPRSVLNWIRLDEFKAELEMSIHIDGSTFSLGSECVDIKSTAKCEKEMKNGNCKLNRIQKNCQKTCGLCKGIIYFININGIIIF